MIAFGIGCCLVGGGLKGMLDNLFRPTSRRPIREHTPVRS